MIDAPAALHRGEDDLPFVEFGPGQELQLLQVDLDNGMWVIRNRFQPGTAVTIKRLSMDDSNPAPAT